MDETIADVLKNMHDAPPTAGALVFESNTKGRIFAQVINLLSTQPHVQFMAIPKKDKPYTMCNTMEEALRHLGYE